MVEGRRRWAPALNQVTAGLPDDTGSLLRHHHIARLSAPTESAGLRAGSCHDTMASHGLQEHIRVVPADLSEHSGFEAMNSLIQFGRTPTAVLAADDNLLGPAGRSVDIRILPSWCQRSRLPMTTASAFRRSSHSSAQQYGAGAGAR